MAVARRGKLRLVVGYAPGVGKTSALLRSAHDVMASGRRLLVGFANPRGRADVARLLEGLPVLPPKRVRWRGVEVEDMDYVGLVAAAPEVAVIDDVAHTNLPGSEHRRRYQDVLALLDLGVDVYAAVDVPHLESLQDLVRRVAGREVRETVPDRFFRDADEWRLVDVPADELSRRNALVDPQSPALDLLQLSALREMALREVAEALERRARPGGRAEEARPVGRRTGEMAEAGRVMVGMSSFPARATALLRRGSRLAGRLNTSWFVVYVETPETRPARLDEASLRHLFANIELARELGAEVVRLESTDPAAALLDFARSHGVGHLVIGRSRASWWRQVVGQSVAMRLVREGREFDILIAALTDKDDE